MPTIIDSLFVSLGWKIQAEGLEKYAKTTETLKHGMLAVGAAVSGVVYGIERMVHGTAERMGGIQRFGDQMGISAREVAALGRVAAENDSSLEAMEGGLRSMTMMAGQAAQGVGRGAMIFKRFGIQVKDSHGQVKPMNQLLGDVADKMAKLPSLAQKQALGARLGFDPAIIQLLSKGRAEFERMSNAALKAGMFGDKDYENAERTEEGFKHAGQAVQRLRDKLAVGLFPVVNDLLAKFTAWVKDEKNIAKVSQAVNKVVEVVGALARNLDKILAVLAVIYAHRYGIMFLEWGTKIVAVVTQLKNAASAAALLSMGFKAIQGILTAGVLGLLILVAEDLWTFHRGGVSVTGWMLTKFPQAVDAMKLALVGLGAAFLALTTASGPLGLLALGIGGLVVAAMDLKDSWAPVVQWFEEAWDEWGGYLEVLLPPLGILIESGKLLKAAWEPAMTWLGEAWDFWIDKLKLSLKLMAAPLYLAAKIAGISLEGVGDKLLAGIAGNKSGTGRTRAAYAGMDQEWFDRKNAAFDNRTDKGLGPLDGGAGNMLTWGRGGAVTNNTVGSVTINIQGSHDPEATGKAVAKAVRDVHRVHTMNGQKGAH